MPVEPLQLHDDGTVAVQHGAHSGTVVPTVLPFWVALVVLTCPTCGASSCWPVTGGADASRAPLLAAIAAA